MKKSSLAGQRRRIAVVFGLVLILVVVVVGYRSTHSSLPSGYGAVEGRKISDGGVPDIGPYPIKRKVTPAGGAVELRTEAPNWATGQVIAHVHVKHDGHFRMVVKAGVYQLNDPDETCYDGGFVEIEAGKTVHADLSCVTRSSP